MIALGFGWPPSEIDTFDLIDLARWANLASAKLGLTDKDG